MLFSKSFNSRAPRGARQVRYGGSYFCARVSIHVPLAEHDLADGEEETREMSFNSRAPRGARPGWTAITSGQSSFNSRAPRGARPGYVSGTTCYVRFNSRAPRGARRGRRFTQIW